MLSRSDTLERLINLRKRLSNSKNKAFPSDDIETVVGELDTIIIDLIGFFPNLNEQIHEIINLSLKEKISVNTATVAIQELVNENKVAKKRKSKPVRKRINKHNNELEKLKARGWNQ